MTSPHLTLITIDLSFHHASAAAVAAMLEKHGVAASEWRVPHERAFELLASGEGDLLCCAWLPGSHGRYLAPMADEVEKLAVLYTPYALWAVPGYVPAESVAEIADLKKPEVAARMLKKIQGHQPRRRHQPLFARNHRPLRPGTSRLPLRKRQPGRLRARLRKTRRRDATG
ncbi:glycine betaine ABC transporter substrate-binding protein [Chromobacterium sphagni]|uniref:glycine betaine ABC transporter substrate-binding protein n=1 Tax=Chromobacterium sphagni TaxID=1903179 RepID=UPI000A7AAB32|nr:glycine betaine ABC transporter substrate-binding protein [Chromobacterium sphagni]